METSPAGGQWSSTADITAASLRCQEAFHFCCQLCRPTAAGADWFCKAAEQAICCCLLHTRYATCRSTAAPSSGLHVRRDIRHRSVGVGRTGGEKGFEDSVLQSLCYLSEAVVDLKDASAEVKCMLVSCPAQSQGLLVRLLFIAGGAVIQKLDKRRVCAINPCFTFSISVSLSYRRAS